MNNNYLIIRIQRYLNGELSREEMYELEREALDDPLLQDAIDGYRLQQRVSHRQLSLLQQRLADRITQQTKERHAFYFGWQRLGVAATACVLMVLVLVLLWMRNHPDPQRGEKEVQVELAVPQAVGIQALPITGTAFDAEPAQGWKAFNAYLAEHMGNELPKGEVLLAFTIDEQGRPAAIRDTEGAVAELLAEAKRLLDNGPTWKGNTGKIKLIFR